MVSRTSTTIDLMSGLMLLTLAAVWGGSFFFAEVALGELTPIWIALIRVSLAVPVLAFVVIWRGIAVAKGFGIWGAYLVMGALNNAIPFSLIFWGQQSIEGGLASILNGTTAVFTVFVAAVILAEEPLRARKVWGAILGILGVGVVMGRDAFGSFDPRDLAQIAILAASLSYAFASAWGRRMLGGQSAIMNALGMLIGSTLLLIPVAIWAEGVPTFAFSASVWGSLVGIAMLSTVLGYFLYFAILARAGAANLMLVTLLIPPFAIGLGAAFLGERLETTAWAGFAIIAVGLLVTDGRLAVWVRSAR